MHTGYGIRSMPTTIVAPLGLRWFISDGVGFHGSRSTQPYNAEITEVATYTNLWGLGNYRRVTDTSHININTS